MTENYQRHYEALGLAPGAAPEEIKRAYFRLVRKYSPEKEPEQFQKIRQAYEALKDGPKEDAGSRFPVPEDPEIRYLLEQAIEAGNLGVRISGQYEEFAADIERRNKNYIRVCLQYLHGAGCLELTEYEDGVEIRLNAKAVDFLDA